MANDFSQHGSLAPHLGQFPGLFDLYDQAGNPKKPDAEDNSEGGDDTGEAEGSEAPTARGLGSPRGPSIAMMTSNRIKEPPAGTHNPVMALVTSRLHGVVNEHPSAIFPGLSVSHTWAEHAEAERLLAIPINEPFKGTEGELARLEAVLEILKQLVSECFERFTINGFGGPRTFHALPYSLAKRLSTLRIHHSSNLSNLLSDMLLTHGKGTQSRFPEAIRRFEKYWAHLQETRSDSWIKIWTSYLATIRTLRSLVNERFTWLLPSLIGLVTAHATVTYVRELLSKLRLHDVSTSPLYVWTPPIVISPKPGQPQPGVASPSSLSAALAGLGEGAQEEGLHCSSAAASPPAPRVLMYRTPRHSILSPEFWSATELPQVRTPSASSSSIVKPPRPGNVTPSFSPSLELPQPGNLSPSFWSSMAMSPPPAYPEPISLSRSNSSGSSHLPPAPTPREFTWPTRGDSLVISRLPRTPTSRERSTWRTCNDSSAISQLPCTPKPRASNWLTCSDSSGNSYPPCTPKPREPNWLINSDDFTISRLPPMPAPAPSDPHSTTRSDRSAISYLPPSPSTAVRQVDLRTPYFHAAAGLWLSRESSPRDTPTSAQSPQPGAISIPGNWVLLAPRRKLDEMAVDLDRMLGIMCEYAKVEPASLRGVMKETDLLIH